MYKKIDILIDKEINLLFKIDFIKKIKLGLLRIV